MLQRYLKNTLDRLPALREQSFNFSHALHQAVMQGGTPARKLSDVLHGTWLGHPLHPVLTDVTIGAWGLGALFDIFAALFDDRFARQMADRLAATGTTAAVPTLVTGLAEFSTVQWEAASTASLHGLLNNVNFVLFLMSVRDRRQGRRRRGVFLSLLAVALSVVSAWLGGHLVYTQRVGVDHSEAQGPDDWTPVLEATELPEKELKRAEADGNPVLLYRLNGTVYAIGAVCNHVGGPLEEGTVEDCYVQCPWHDSAFDLRDGRVKHGPAPRPQPAFATREQDGHIEVQLLQR